MFCGQDVDFRYKGESLFDEDEELLSNPDLMQGLSFFLFE